MNTVCLSGKVYNIKKIETKSGMSMIKFRLQVPRYKEEAFYLDVVNFDKNADFVEKNVKEGSGVSVTGKIDEETWVKDNIVNRRIKIITDRIDFLPRIEKRNQDETQQATSQQQESVF